MKMIKSLTCQATDQRYHPLSLYSATKSVYCLQQGPMITNAHLVDKLKAKMEAVEEIVR